MKKVLCGLVIAFMMTGSGYAKYGSDIQCAELEQRINFHLANAREYFNQATRKKKWYDIHSVSMEHHVNLAEKQVSIYKLICE